MEHLPYLEYHTPGSPGLHIDLFLNRLQLHFDLPALPPIIFINMHRCDPSNKILVII